MTKEVMQQALECIEYLNMRGFILADFETEVYAAINALRKALAQPKQEPVAWMTEDECGVYTRKQVDGYFQHDHIPLYTTPPQRQWVRLTPEEILDLFDLNNVYGSKWVEFAKTVEDKLKERNT